MSATVFVRAVVEGVNLAGVKLGKLAWPSKKVANAACEDVANSLRGPERLEGPLSKESALAIFGALYEKNAQLAKEGHLTKEAADAYVTKVAAFDDVDTLTKIAAKRAEKLMRKVAEETKKADGLLMPGAGNPNTPEAAAAAESTARLDLRNRSIREYLVGVGNTDMPDVGQVGAMQRGMKAPTTGVSNSLCSAKMASFDKAAKAKGLKGLKNTAARALAAGKSMAGKATEEGKSRLKAFGEKAKERVSKHKGALAAAGAGAAGAGLGFAAGRASKDGEKQSALAAALAQEGGGVGAKIAAAKARRAGGAPLSKEAAEQFARVAVMKLAEEVVLDALVARHKIADLEGMSPEELHALAEAIENLAGQDPAHGADLHSLDPHTLEALSQLGAMAERSEPEAPHGGMPGMPGMPGEGPETNAPPPDMKGASLLAQLKRAAEGSLTDVEPNTPTSAAKTESVSALDTKNRPPTEYMVEQGHTEMPNAGRVGATQPAEKSPKDDAGADNTLKREDQKAAEMSPEMVEYVQACEKVAEQYGPHLPSTLSKAEKIAHVRKLVGLSPDERVEYVAALS